eukprot:scaffold6677_cov62-Alexandrium_tamarense.AAC.1
MPNELPLCTFQAMYNEALCTMFAGYNPDSYWDPEAYQGALEAMALGKVHQCRDTTECGGTGDANIAVAEVKVDDNAAKELQDILAKQTLEIEELVRMLDEYGDECAKSI